MKICLKLVIFTFLSVLFFSSCQNEAAQIVNAVNRPAPKANAGSSRTVLLPVNTTTLNGSGSSQNGPIVGYLWSLVSGPNLPNILSPSSPTTTINNLVAGNYVFQFAIIDSAGFTGIDTASIQVIGVTPPPPPVQQTLTVQPGANPIELNFAVNGNNNVSAQDIDVDAEAWTSGGNPFTIRGAFKFDLSSIPSNATIISAKLSLYSNPTPINGDQTNPNSGSNNSMWIRRLTSPFTASSSWASQPGTEVNSQVLIAHTSSSTLDLIDVDVKNIVVSIQANGNNGFMIGLQNEVAFNARQFASSRNSNTSKRPKIVVVYQ